LFSLPTENQEGQTPVVGQVKAPCHTSEQLMTVLEEITGWKSEFTETPLSYRNRAQDGMEDQPAQGSFSIVDMSADWPANQFTSHRGKCDQLVGLISDLVGELQSAKLELSRIRSAVAALPGETVTEQDDEVLVDSFVPKFGRIEIGSVGFGSEVGDYSGKASFESGSRLQNDEFEVLQELGEELVSPPFAGWSLGGTTGIVEDTYLDWLVDGQERIAISVGKIESAFGDGDRLTVLKVEPLTSEYRVAARGDLTAFYHWDAAATQIRLAEPSTQWTRLGVGDAIIASTNSNLDLDIIMAELESQPPTELTADTIAQAINQATGSSERTLVLKRGQS